MSIFQSLRWRIQMWHGLLLLAVITGFCALTYHLESANAHRQGDSELKARLDVLAHTLGRSGRGDVPPSTPPDFASPELNALFAPPREASFYFILWSRRGPVLERSPGSPSEVPRPAWTDQVSLRTRPGFREVYLYTPPGECLLVGRALAPIEEELRGFALWLTAIGCGTLGLGLAGGWWFSTKALRPVEEIRFAATQVADGRLAARIPVPESSGELGRLSAVLNETFARLEAAFAQQERFTSDAAHELRTPVALILAQAQLALARPRSDAEYREALETTQRAARRMHGLIESLLELSRLDAGAPSPGRRAADLATLGREQLALLQPLAAKAGITLRGDLEPAPCEIDPDRVTQILVNLLENAVKFSPPGSEVRLATRCENGDAVLSVSDHGPGIDPVHLPHVFERFYRADASRNRVTGGAGLGLSISRRIAEAHGGTLTVESRAGEGSCFTLHLPGKR